MNDYAQHLQDLGYLGWSPLSKFTLKGFTKLADEALAKAQLSLHYYGPHEVHVSSPHSLYLVVRVSALFEMSAPKRAELHAMMFDTLSLHVPIGAKLLVVLSP